MTAKAQSHNHLHRDFSWNLPGRSVTSLPLNPTYLFPPFPNSKLLTGLQVSLKSQSACWTRGNRTKRVASRERAKIDTAWSTRPQVSQHFKVAADRLTNRKLFFWFLSFSPNCPVGISHLAIAFTRALLSLSSLPVSSKTHTHSWPMSATLLLDEVFSHKWGSTCMLLVFY